jgi:hypothetical protein
MIELVSPIRWLDELNGRGDYKGAGDKCLPSVFSSSEDLMIMLARRLPLGPNGKPRFGGCLGGGAHFSTARKLTSVHTLAFLCLANTTGRGTGGMTLERNG